MPFESVFRRLLQREGCQQKVNPSRSEGSRDTGHTSHLPFEREMGNEIGSPLNKGEGPLIAAPH